MGTIDISYFNLLIGLLLLVIPTFLSLEVQNRITESHPDRDSTHDRATLPDRYVPEIPFPVE